VTTQVFDFKRHGDPSFGAPVQVQDARWKSAEGKMEQSFLTFAAVSLIRRH
jgi:hypothetical protein